MRHVLLALVSLSVVAVFAGCDYPTVGDGVEGPALGAFNTSGCKLESAQQRSLMDGNMIEAVVYETSVTIIHHDAQYQCNADISWELEVNGSTLILREVDKSTVVTRCMCPMDLSTTIENLAVGGKYTIQVWDEFETRMFGEVTVDLGDCNAQCVTDEDCWSYPDLPRLDCEGRWACIQGLCNYACEPYDPGCTSDADCPEGFQCVFYSNGGGATEPAPDGTMAQRMIAYECRGNEDCPDGMVCEMNDCACEPGVDCDCYPSGYCTGGQVWPTEGYCEPIVINNECRSDADCGSGYHCEFYYPVPVSAGAAESDAAAPADPMPIPECYCTEEWAPVCGANGVTYSNYCFAKCAMVDVVYEGECQGGQGIGYCVPDQQPGCYSDYDCPDGHYCQMTDWCAGVDYDQDGVIDPTWCMGQCLPKKPQSCEGMGGFCIGLEENRGCPEGYEWIMDGIYEDGSSVCGQGMACCVPTQPPQECWSDDDCYKMFGDSSDPATGVPVEWACVDGFCQVRQDCGQMQCYSDADCGDGMICMATGWCDPAGWCCETTMCVPVEEPPYCNSSRECADGETCINGVCVYEQPACSSDSDCGDGLVCIDGLCQFKGEDCVRDDSGMCMCGGFAGFACPDGMACSFDDPNCSPDAGGADCMGHCYAVPDECVCDMMYAPVCGNDGRTYSNKCMAACAGVKIVSEGECPRR